MKSTRSLSELHTRTPSTQKIIFTNEKFQNNNNINTNENFESNENKVKCTASESVIKSNENENDDYNDDDDVWCHPDDESNLENRVKCDNEKIEQLRTIFSNETFQMIFESFQVKK